ncbi:N-acetylmuramidase domain-containing protein [Neisseria sp. S1]|uniref:N-acetylmuramidase domain-containing protein n=1 Tax=Neisseria sp. S1 TaxID=3318354 RepID=UPI003A8BC10D
MSTILKVGSVGSEVAALQGLLNAAGHKVEVDGWFGRKTEQAVRAFQASQLPPLVVDGRAGMQTMAALRGQRQENMLDQTAIESAAAMLDVDVAAIMAVNQVEARGRGFLNDGRVKILFERHIFYKLLKEKHGVAYADKIAATSPHVCNKARGGYKGGAAEYPRFSRAFYIDGEIAMMSCSWGAYQIMGFNHRAAGFKTVGEFVDTMKTSENAHLIAFAEFIKADKNLHQALKNRDWADFARRYNGPDYRANAYDTKLANAYVYFGGQVRAA